MIFNLRLQRELKETSSDDYRELAKVAGELTALRQLRPDKARKASWFQAITGKSFGWYYRWGYVVRPAAAAALLLVFVAPVVATQSGEGEPLAGARHAVERVIGVEPKATPVPTPTPVPVQQFVPAPAAPARPAPAVQRPRPEPNWSQWRRDRYDYWDNDRRRGSDRDRSGQDRDNGRDRRGGGDGGRDRDRS